jgi:signal transduction histidine kinase/ligand-binding sensor domain-containing protein
MLLNAVRLAWPFCRWLDGVALAAALAMASCAAQAATDGGDYLIDVWTGENGLPNSSVTAIAQTPDGYLWVGTYNGLARFDGVRFVRFDPSDTPALPKARIRRLYVDPVGTLWINTYDGSLISYRNDFRLEWKGNNTADATITSVALHPDRTIFLLHSGELIRRRSGEKEWQVLRPPGASSGALCVQDGQGVLWGRNRDQKLWRYTGEHFESMPANAGLQGRQINALVTDARGRVWAGTEKEVAVWEDGCFRTMTPTNGEPDLNVAFLSPARGGELWILDNDRVRKARDRQWVLEAKACRGVFTGRMDRFGAQEDRNGGVWLYHYGKGIFHLRPDGEARQLATEEEFPGERVDCFYEDREGNLWAGVDRGGLVRLRQKRFQTLIPPENRLVVPNRNSPGDDPGSSTRQGAERVAVKAAVSVAEDSLGAIWIGTYGAGLLRLQDGGWQSLAVPGGTRRGFVFSVCPDRQAKLWVSAGEEDLFVESDGQFQPSSPAVHGVKALLTAQDGRLWVGTKNGLWTGTQGQMRQFRAAEGIARGNDIRALAEGPGGEIWAGADNGTLYRVISNHIDSFQVRDGLPAQPIWSLLADEDGSVWLGTFRGGLLNFRDGKFVRYTAQDGLPNDVICQILEDGRGRLWMGSQQGIFCVAKAELAAFAAGGQKSINCTAYGRYDGLPSLECSSSYQPAAWRATDGRLLFTTLKGVVAVQPEETTPNQLPPPVVIEDVLVDGQRSAFPASQSTPLSVAPGKRQIEFRFTGLSFVSPDRVRFRYKLDGLDKDYIEAGTRRSAQYSFLRPGNYTFHVTACNNDGVWNEAGATLALGILPHFYETWWFMTIAGIAAAGSVAGTVRHFVARRLRVQLEHLQQQRAIERDRARIAQDIHDDLGAGLTQIMLLSELARHEPPQGLQSHLGQISDMARGLTRTMDEIVWAVDPQHDTLNGLMDYASAYTQEFLRIAGTRCRLDVPASLPAMHVDAELRYNLFLALKEALNNIVKHARATEVWLRLRLQPNGFVLVVEDNGQGLPGAAAGAENGERLISGHGLNNLEKRLRAVGGRCEVYSAAGEGTRIEMTTRVGASSSPVVAIGANGANGVN